MNNYPQAGNAQDRKENQPGSNRELAALPLLTGVKVDPWVDTRLVRFDDTIAFGHGGFDFDRWESLRLEMHTRHGSFAVWQSDSKTWSMYGGKYAILMLDRFSSEEEAKAEAEQIVISLDAEPSPRAQALEEAEQLDAATAALISLTDAGIPTDVQELLIVGDPSRGIAPGSLSKAIATVIRALSSQPIADKKSDEFVAYRFKHRNDGPHMWEYYPLPVEKSDNPDFVTQALTLKKLLAILNSDQHADRQSQPVADAPFQERVKPWMLACFGEEISNDKLERCDRFIEEALELVQAIGYSTDRAHALVEYVFNRDIGEPHQEVGGVMVTLAALCLASGLDMNKAAEDELARIWTKVEKIRAKQAAKPTGSALPISLPASPGASE